MNRNPLVDPYPGDIVRVGPGAIDRYVTRRFGSTVWYKHPGAVPEVRCRLGTWIKDLCLGVVVFTGGMIPFQETPQSYPRVKVTKSGRITSGRIRKIRTAYRLDIEGTTLRYTVHWRGPEAINGYEFVVLLVGRATNYLLAEVTCNEADLRLMRFV